MNKKQKILATIYLILLCIIFLYITPYDRNDDFHAYYINIAFGNFFVITKPIIYNKLFAEISVLTIFFALYILKESPKRKLIVQHQ